MKKPYIFTNYILEKMKYLGLNEDRIIEVVRTGDKRTLQGNQTSTRKYMGYEIGVMFSQDSKTGEYFLISVWKRINRR